MSYFLKTYFKIKYNNILKIFKVEQNERSLYYTRTVRLAISLHIGDD